MAGGLAAFGVSYAATIGINYGVCGSGATWSGCSGKALSFLPVAGPFIFAGAPKTEASYRGLAVGLGLGQALGALLVGMSFAGSHSEKAAVLVPSAGRDGGGATLMGRF